MGEKSPRELEDEIAKTRRDVLTMMDRTRQEIESFRKELGGIRKELRGAIKELIKELLDVVAFFHSKSLLETISLDVVSPAFNMHKNPHNLIKSAFQDVGKFVTGFSQNPSLADFALEAAKSPIAALIAASRPKIKFDELVSIMLETLPREIAKKIVPLEIVTKAYGMECTIKLKNLLGIQ